MVEQGIKIDALFTKFIINGRDVLSDDLQVYVSSSRLNTKELSDEMNARVRNDLAWYP